MSLGSGHSIFKKCLVLSREVIFFLNYFNSKKYYLLLIVRIAQATPDKTGLGKSLVQMPVALKMKRHYMSDEETCLLLQMHWNNV